MRYFRKFSARSGFKKPVALKDVISQYLQTCQVPASYVESDLRTSWNQMMGKPISDRTKHFYVKDKILYIELTSAPLKQELSMSTTKIRDCLNRDFGKKMLDKVVFL